MDEFQSVAHVVQCFVLVVFISLYKGPGVSNVLVCRDEIIDCDKSSESYGAVLCYGTVYYAVQGGYVDEILKCDHSNESC